MQIRFDGQAVVVAGAARGIGRAIAEAFAAEGADVFAGDLLVEEVAGYAELPEASGRIAAHHIDVTDSASVKALIDAASRKRGHVDCLVYVAGGVRGQHALPIEEVSLEAFSEIVDANLTGAFLCAKTVVPGMKLAGKGRIVTISSRAGLATSLTGIQSYAASKHGQVGLVKQLAQELGPFGITVNSVAPGFLMTSPDYERQWNSYSEEFRKGFVERIAMRRIGKPSDIADAVLFLASDRASWITGQVLPITGSPLM